MPELSLFEKCRAIKRTLLNRAAESISMKTWSDDFRLKNLYEIHTTVAGWEKEYGSFKIDPNQLTEEELTKLEFGRWEEGNPLRLIPLWLFPFLAETLETISIDGTKHSTLAELDNDTRFGCIAYGVIPKDLKDGNKEVPKMSRD